MFAEFVRAYRWYRRHRPIGLDFWVALVWADLVLSLLLRDPVRLQEDLALAVLGFGTLHPFAVRRAYRRSRAEVWSRYDIWKW